MKVKDLRPKSETELRELLKELRNRLFKFRQQKLQAQLKNVREIAATKKDIARILGLLKK